MSIIPGGVRLTGFIAPNDSGDTYAVSKPIYGLGGLRTVDFLTDRDAITSERREEGMLVYVKQDLNYYQLASGLTNSDWVNLFLTSGTGTTGTITQFNVSASGTNAYTGVSTPTITGYNETDLYLTQFDNSNTVTGVTLNINGYGALNLVKGTVDGLLPLDVDDIQTGVTYFLTYDGSQFQFFTSTPFPPQVPGTYTNLTPTTATIGGVPAGTTFSAVTWQSVFDSMFYPTQTPTFTSFLLRALSTASTQAQTLEVGNSVSGGSRVFTWATSNSSFVKPGTIKILDAGVQISTPTSGMTNDGVEAISRPNKKKTAQASNAWTITGVRTNNVSFSTSFSVVWYFRRFYGVTTATTLTTSAAVNAFSGNASFVSSTTGMAGTFTLNGAGYKYFFVPTTFAFPNLFRDFNTNLAVAMASVSDDPFFSGVSGSYYYGTTPVTNAFGIVQNYRVYRTRNLLNGNIIITIT